MKLCFMEVLSGSSRLVQLLCFPCSLLKMLWGIESNGSKFPGRFYFICWEEGATGYLEDPFLHLAKYSQCKNGENPVS